MLADFDAFVTISRFSFGEQTQQGIATEVRLPGLLSEVVFACYIVDKMKPGDYEVDETEKLISSPDS